MSFYKIPEPRNIVHEGAFTFEFPTAEQAASFADRVQCEIDVTCKHGHRVVDVYGADLESVEPLAREYGGRQQ